MTLTLWRIGTDTRDYLAEDMSGLGAARHGGRWNEQDIPVVYTSTSRSLACLETLVHLSADALPLNRYLVAVTVPQEVSRMEANAPIGWDAQPAGMVSIQYGSEWIRSEQSAILIVPSTIVPEELNYLINPAHPDARLIKAEKVRKWTYDRRLKVAK